MFFWGFLGNRLWGQNSSSDDFTHLKNVLPNVILNSPSVADMQKFGLYKVNLFNGLPDISIPIYEIKVGKISVPITIKYHASGIKVNEIGNGVGLGWSLDVGGAITRTTIGGADEIFFDKNNSIKHATSYDNKNYSDLYWLDYYSTNNVDFEPDIYNYKLPTNSGSFTFNAFDNNKIITLNKNADKIIKNSYYNYTIIDQEGLNYTFDIVDIFYSTLSLDYQNKISAIKLSKISDPNSNDSINLNYINYNISYNDISFESIRTSDYITSPQRTLNNIDTKNAILPQSFYLTNLNSGTENFIKEIVFNKGKIKFNYAEINANSLSNKIISLKNIEIYALIENDYQLQYLYEFNQIYFNSSKPYIINNNNFYDDTLKKRQILNSIKITDNLTKMESSYTLEYNQIAELPSLFSKSRDYWGYYNGKYNTSLIPDKIINWNNGIVNDIKIHINQGASVNREVDTNYSQIGMLKKIFYPTGGSTEFIFESNKYLDNDFNLKIAGGHRIKKIINYDADNKILNNKLYKYGLNENGYGFKNFNINNFENFKYTLISNFSFSIPCNFSIIRNRTFTDHNFSYGSLESLDGSIVNYTNVTEYNLDNLNNILNGKIVYTYSHKADNILSSFLPYKIQNESNYLQRGLLLKKQIYSLLNNINYTLLEEYNYTYHFLKENNLPIGLRILRALDGISTDNWLNGFYNCILNNPVQNPFMLMDYKINTIDQKLVSQNHILYNANSQNNLTNNKTFLVTI